MNNYETSELIPAEAVVEIINKGLRNTMADVKKTIKEVFQGDTKLEDIKNLEASLIIGMAHAQISKSINEYLKETL